MNSEEFKKLTIESCKKAVASGYKIIKGVFYYKDDDFVYCCPLTSFSLNKEIDLNSYQVTKNVPCLLEEARLFYRGFDSGEYKNRERLIKSLADSERPWYMAGYETYQELTNLGIEICKPSS